MNRSRKTDCMILMCLLLFSCVGCGKRNVDNHSSDPVSESSVQSENGGISNPKEIDTEQIWQTEFDVESEKGNVGHVKIYADILVPDTDTLSVATVKEIAFDKEFKKNLAEKLYENGTVYESETLTKKEIAEKIEIENELIQEMQDEMTNLSNGESGLDAESAEDFLELYGNEIENSRKYINDLTDMLENAPEEHLPATDYSEDSYTGELDGVRYNLEFFNSREMAEPDAEPGLMGEIKQISGSRDFWFEPESLGAFVPEELQGMEGVLYDSEEPFSGKNQCSLLEEDAVKSGEQFLSRLGFSDLSLFSVRPVTFRNSNAPEQFVTDGWSLTFCRKINGAATDPNLNGYIVKTKRGDEEFIYTSEAGSYVTLEFNDRGILYFRYSNPMEQTAVTEEIEILPLETVENIMEDILKNDTDSVLNRPESYNAYTLSFNYMSLIYFRMRNREVPGEYSYVPVWELTNTPVDPTGSAGSDSDWLLINAISGERIDLVYELTGVEQSDK